MGDVWRYETTEGKWYFVSGEKHINSLDYFESMFRPLLDEFHLLIFAFGYLQEVFVLVEGLKVLRRRMRHICGITAVSNGRFLWVGVSVGCDQCPCLYHSNLVLNAFICIGVGLQDSGPQLLSQLWQYSIVDDSWLVVFNSSNRYFPSS